MSRSCLLLTFARSSISFLLPPVLCNTKPPRYALTRRNRRSLTLMSSRISFSLKIPNRCTRSLARSKNVIPSSTWLWNCGSAEASFDSFRPRYTPCPRLNSSDSERLSIGIIDRSRIGDLLGRRLQYFLPSLRFFEARDRHRKYVSDPHSD